MQNLLPVVQGSGSHSNSLANSTQPASSGKGSSEGGAFGSLLEASFVAEPEGAVNASELVSAELEGSGLLYSLQSLDLSLESLDELKSILLSYQGQNLAELEVGPTEGGEGLPILSELIEQLDGLFANAEQSVPVSQLQSLQASLEGARTHLMNLPAGTPLSANVSMEQLLKQLDALNSSLSKSLAQHKQAAIADDAGNLNSSSSFSNQFQSVGRSQLSGEFVSKDPGALTQQLAEGMTIDDLSLSNAKNSLPIDQKLDLELIASDKLRLDSSRSSFAEIQAKLLNPSERLYSTTVGANVFDPDWSSEVGQKIVWMTSREIKSAEIHLNPAELGPIDVKVSVQSDNTASVNINAQNATVREMLESQVARLREMMEQNGLSLADVNVGAETGDQAKFAQEQQQGKGGSGLDESEDELQASAPDSEAVLGSSNIVDFYA